MSFRSSVSLVLVACFIVLLQAQTASVPVIFDTDMDTDVDDVGALAVLHALADRGEAKILATVVSSKFPSSAGCVAAINQYYGRGDLPVGGPKGEGASTHRGSRYARQIAQEFPHSLENSEVPDAVGVYRQILAAQPDFSVTVVTVGYVTNLRDLLLSEPDAHSPLDGFELVRRKVEKWVCMGGRYPHHLDPREFGNFKPDPTAARLAAESWPTPIIFTGIGDDILTGSRVRREGDPANPVRRAYDLYLGERPARQSWDLVAVLFAVRGTSSFFEVQTQGYNHIFADGTNVWREAPERKNHQLLQLKADPAEVESALEELMIQAPREGGDGAVP